MGEGTVELKRFTIPYTKKGKHRRKCRVCGKLISDGEMTLFIMVKETKYYPVKGLMGFVNTLAYHASCKES